MTDTPHVSAEELMAFADGEVAAARAGEIGAHVQACPGCRRELDEHAAVGARLAVWKVDAPPATLTPPAGQAARPAPAPLARIGAVAAAAALVIAAVWAVRRPHEPPRVEAPSATAPAPAPPALDPGTFALAWAQQPRVDPGVSPGGSRVLIVAFMDWLCHPCHVSYQSYRPVLKRYEQRAPGQVKLVVRDWPWDSRCNPHVHGLEHPGACTAALVVRLARDRDKADEMMQWLFENMSRLQTLDPADAEREIQAEARRLLGIGSVDFDAAIAAARAGLDADIEAGAALDITQTPTFFINGVRVPSEHVNGPLTPESLDAAIAIELKRAARRA